jgi:formate-dependent nitrite reductase cytochrome c552 subunit
MIQGTHAYLFGGAAYSSSPHATIVRDACIGCHMGNTQQHDGYDVGGHSFNMRFESHNGTEYTMYLLCKGCHGPEYSDNKIVDFNGKFAEDFDKDGLLEGAQKEFDDLRDSLGNLLVTRGALKKSSSGVFSIDTVIVALDVAGAVYNFSIYQEDRSHGIHNPAFIQGMLLRSIDYLNNNPAPMRRDEVAVKD